MADRINDKEESIARVYQFLNTKKNWQKEADINGNGTIIKTEFRAFLLNSSFKFNSGENKEDLIDTFWKSIDINTTGKIQGKGVSNKKALDETELNNVEKTLEATKKITTFMQDKEAPTGINEDLRVKWKNSVKQGLIYRASEFLKNASVENITDEWLNESYKISSAKATADYTATSVIKEKLGDVEGYTIGDDDQLKDLVSDYVSQLEGSEKDAATIMDEVRKLVEAYVDTAKTNSSASTNLLAQYNYDPDGPLNNLQSAVLINNLTDKILESIKASNPEIAANENYVEQAKAVIKEYVKNYIDDRSASEFTKLQAFDVSEFAKSDDYNTLIKSIEEQQTALKQAQDSLYSYVTNVLTETDEKEAKTRAVATAVGSSELTSVKNKIYSTKTIAEVNDLRAKIDAELQSELDKIAAEIAAKEAEYKAAFSGLAGNIEDIKYDNRKAMTDGKAEIHTEFGMDEQGNIVFEQSDTRAVYDKVVDTLVSNLKAKNREAFDTIGEANIKKLIQASWISAYNKFPSSQSHSTSAFITEVCNQFEKILNKLSEHPEYLTAFISHSAYANERLTSNVMHYGTEDTIGNDAIWSYEGFKSVASDGTITWDSKDCDDHEYETAMDQLLRNIKNSPAYKGIGEDILTSVFRDAQNQAINACVSNKNDCPYGTTTTVDRGIIFFGPNGKGEGTSVSSPIATEGTDWSGLSREDDGSKISPKALIEMTLYYFDKLLYAELAK